MFISSDPNIHVKNLVVWHPSALSLYDAFQSSLHASNQLVNCALLDLVPSPPVYCIPPISGLGLGLPQLASEDPPNSLYDVLVPALGCVVS